GYARAPRILRGVKQLDPGSYGVVREGRLAEAGRYWRPAARPREISEKDALPLIRETVKKAVSSRLESDVLLGAFLSGGIDSTIVVREMREAGAADLHTFSVGFSDGEGYDESPWAKKVAALFGTKHHEQIVEGDEALLSSVLSALDEPMADSSAIGVYALTRHARKGITVALGGDGGDEVFCGYERFTGVELTEKIPKVFRHALRSLAPLVPNTKGYGNRGDRLRRVLREGWRDSVEKLLRWQAMSPPEDALLLIRPELRPTEDFPWPLSLEGKSPFHLHEILQANFESYLPDDLLVKTDRMTMSHGLELRSPFLAREVIELGLSLPKEGLLKGRTLKYWLKTAYRGIIPDEILDRRKHGFGMPVHLWWRGKLQKFAGERLLDSSSPLWNHLGREAVQALWDGHQQGNFDAGQRIYGLLVLGHWLRRIAK
ncbi:MAG: asparagine synthase C-terminal domain-containing protein, partial [Bdellovibrionota bacterium]